MYTPEINFLKQRAESAAAAAGSGGTVISPTVAKGIRSGANTFVFGLVFGLVVVVAYGFFDQVTRKELARLKDEQAQVTSDLGVAQAELSELRDLETELNNIRARTNAFKSFFNQVQPWSSILEDIRNQIPADVWITEINADGNNVTIAGQSPGFDPINDFQLTLLQSALVDNVTLGSAVLTAIPPEVEGDPEIEVVDYEMQMELTASSIEALLDTLAANGSIGLVQKVEILRELENQQ